MYTLCSYETPQARGADAFSDAMQIGSLARLRHAIRSSSPSSVHAAQWTEQPSPQPAQPMQWRGPPIAGIIFGAASSRVAEECLDRRLFALPRSHAAVIKSIVTAPDNVRAAVRCFLYDHEKRELHGIFRPDDVELEAPRANKPIDAYAFSECDWGGVKRADAEFERAKVPATPFSAQIRVAVVRGYAPIPLQAFANIVPFGQHGRPQFLLDTHQVREIAKLYVIQGI